MPPVLRDRDTQDAIGIFFQLEAIPGADRLQIDARPFAGLGNFGPRGFALAQHGDGTGARTLWDVGWAKRRAASVAWMEGVAW